jgi:peptidoglycan/xylan/chitin deacetylase (PgdA/CDA1 family)
MPGIFCLGYDVEDPNPITTRLFLQKMDAIHTDRNVPCSLFIRGQTLEKNVDQFRQLLQNPLYDLEQHTYSHLIFKQIAEEVDREITYHGNDEPLELIRGEVAKTSQLFRDLLDLDIHGLTAPYAFYDGLRDRPDILQVLLDEGIRFCRSYGRNVKGTGPVSLDIQPFFYSEQGFPEILECPLNGWQDVLWRGRFGWTANWEKQVFMELDYVAEHDLYLGVVQHDWSSIYEDLEMDRTAKILDYAAKCDVQFMHYWSFYEAVMSGRVLLKT